MLHLAKQVMAAVSIPQGSHYYLLVFLAIKVDKNIPPKDKKIVYIVQNSCNQITKNNNDLKLILHTTAQQFNFILIKLY